MTTDPAVFTPPPLFHAVIADPSASSRQKLAQTLADAGVHVTATANQHEAPLVCVEHPEPVALVMMDIGGRSGDAGFEAARRICTLPRRPRPRLVGMVEHRALYEPDLCGTLGLHDLLVKPIGKWLVLNLVQEMIGAPPA